ncbi:Ribosomal RNA small subunit methyltransferase E [Marinomonas gallaica]|uniref:Ribosomal RNA small subunit methyltransferase E n=1 Tax=Marinomonas gallaica TaxID=1806667 RepID=A0A1C3JPV0_9GAMM|nr:16S rRNA (uracil(1498)-N(3))-methyltransferase [Marinomonas gallaica]SBT17281.1 Ribosomal RNA small subunit methyltransferase E [Marinomonas gallaica]SBT22275.1 Ribosomal RNA small subunit methyltransferase E [Marinomonas gallaica]
MRIPRIFVDLPLAEHSTFDFPDSAFQHCCKVLRLKENHPIVLFNGQGGQYQAKLLNVQKRSAQVAVDTFEVLNNESPVLVTIGQSISRGERMDYAIQKAVESGVYKIQPLFSERCEVRLNDARLEKRVQHWQQVAISAAEQSGRGIVPEVCFPIDLQDWVSNCNEMLKLTLHHHSARPLNQFTQPDNQKIALLIGPEGGLSEAEVGLAEQQGFSAIALGPRVLRTETAPIVALTALNLLWGDL